MPPPPPPPKYIVEEGDEFNDETFGDLNDDAFATPDFDFSSQAHHLPDKPAVHPQRSQPQSIPQSAFRESPITPSPSPRTPRRGMNAAELEQQILAGGMPQQAQQKKKVMSLEELESTLQSSLSFDNKFGQSPLNSPLGKFPSAPAERDRPLSPPPGLAVKSLPKAPVTITFPKHDEEDPEDGGPRSMDPNRHLMTKFEREGIRRIHMAQLTTEKPALEDFYYQAYSKRSLKNKDQSNTPLYLPLPNLKKKQQSKDRATDHLEGVLGKVSASSSKKPRQLLNIEQSNSPLLSGKLENLSAEELHFNVLATIEKLYTACFALEDVLDQGDDTDYDAQVAEQMRKTVSADIAKILMLSGEEVWERDQIFRFVRILSLPKGRKAVFRAIRYMKPEVTGQFMARLMENLEYLDVFRPSIAYAEIESFVNLILSPLVPFVSESSPAFVVNLMGELLGKKSFLWLALSRPGLILMCILLSRIEICKSIVTPGSDEEALLTKDWAKTAKTLYDLLADRLNDFFHIPSSPTPPKPGSPNGGNRDGGDFYVWQFFALLALNAEPEDKKAMVVELRDRIMLCVQKGSQKDLANLNIFLNVLGLDSSQLAGQQ